MAKMGSGRPKRVELCEVGPRDGFQFDRIAIPTELKLEVLRLLIESGLPRIQITSFVHPGRVPQMADAEEVVKALGSTEGVIFSGLALNERGVQRAADTGLTHVDLSIATNEQHGHDNANMSVAEGVDRAMEMIRIAHEAGLQVQLGAQTVWGYQIAGDTPMETVLELAERFSETGLESGSLADSTGLANPDSIRRVVRAVRDIIDAPIVLHLHDTRGLGIANIVAALDEGVHRFDTSLGGMGGCPFIPGATGNVATEDVDWALSQLDIQTGLDATLIAAASRMIAEHLGKPHPGRLWSLLS